MPGTHVSLSTGIPGLDRVFRGIMPGDNVVWQVETVEDCLPFVEPYRNHAVSHGQRFIYFRFADHPPLLDPGEGVEVVDLRPEEGFEPFIRAIHATIRGAAYGTCYLFDCLSRLAPDWNSDRMLGNFFMLICPLLYDRAALAYFSILRNYHSFHAVKPISGTTQILVDAFRRHGRLYIQPVKVQHRNSSTMYTLHVRDGESFVPVTQSCIITETRSGDPWRGSDMASARLGFWTKTFAAAEKALEDADRGMVGAEETDEWFRRLLRMLVSRDSRVLDLAARYLSFQDLLEIRRRMIGTGLIGGKAVGMLLARAILTRTDPERAARLEAHDSFYVGADVFCTYLVQNGCWWLMQKHRKAVRIEDDVETARRRILAGGEFPPYIIEQFTDMLDYFGPSPIIVRSSSLLEDSFGNAFAGKYRSVFCANQGGIQKRLEDFLSAVRTVYASTVSEEALEYRAERGLLERDEQMALLIQRVSGASYGSLFFPQAAGVAFSVNPYVWSPEIDPAAGMMRLVFGVGTRAVDRVDDDYTRIVALNAPLRRPEAGVEEVRRYSQRRVDVLDLEASRLDTRDFGEVLSGSEGIPIDVFASPDIELERRLARDGRQTRPAPLLTFDRLLSRTSFVAEMRSILQTLSAAYDCPVDVEFTLNFTDSDAYRLSLVQCRPLQVRAAGGIPPAPANLAEERILFRCAGPVIGRSTVLRPDTFVYVVPEVYGMLPPGERFRVARAIGRLTRHPDLRPGKIVLMGPGRWGTTTAALGVPVSFAEIASVRAVFEIVSMRGDFVPDVSLGTHFFSDIVENDMLYVAFFPDRQGNRLDGDLFGEQAPNRLAELLPEARGLETVLRVISAGAFAGRTPVLHADALQQRVLCFLEDPPEV